MALRLEAALGTTAEMWMNIQSQFDLWQARQKAAEFAGEINNKAHLLKRCALLLRG
jgi:plasmid maintenance system antidote protein VapI